VGQIVSLTEAGVARYGAALDNVNITAHDTATQTFTTSINNHGIAAGDLLIACNYRQAAVFQVTAANTGNGFLFRPTAARGVVDAGVTGGTSSTAGAGATVVGKGACSNTAAATAPGHERVRPPVRIALQRAPDVHGVGVIAPHLQQKRTHSARQEGGVLVRLDIEGVARVGVIHVGEVLERLAAVQVLRAVEEFDVPEAHLLFVQRF
jgi:type IV pilus assembly protein PilW